MNIIEAQAKKFSVEMYLADSNIEIDEISSIREDRTWATGFKNELSK